MDKLLYAGSCFHDSQIFQKSSQLHDEGAFSRGELFTNAKRSYKRK